MISDRGFPKAAYRALVKDGAVHLAAYGYDLVPARLARRLLGPPGTVPGAIVDLAVVGSHQDRELLVAPVSHLDAEATSTLVRWASTTGYRRVWLPEAIVELEAAGDEQLIATVECLGCGTRWWDEGLAFWSSVWIWGEFPDRCVLCGSRLPQWSVVPIDRDEKPSQLRPFGGRDGG